MQVVAVVTTPLVAEAVLEQLEAMLEVKLAAMAVTEL
jgi:hypothetical protein